MNTRKPSLRRRGSVLIYAVSAMSVMTMVGLLAIDLGMLEMAKAESQSAADSIGRFAATGFESGDVNLVRTRAEAAANEMTVAGKPIKFSAHTDLVFGVWNAANRTFSPVDPGQEQSATAVRIDVHSSVQRDTAISGAIASGLGLPPVELTRSAVVTRGKTIAPEVPGTACPWLAGMPNGTVHAYDGNTQSISGPAYQPIMIDLSVFEPGEPLRFRQSTGTTSMWGWPGISMDGYSPWIVRQRPENGINATSAPIAALMGIFLDHRAPDTYPMAPEMNFSSPASRDFKTLTPQLKQVFFIGDGLDSLGNLQEFVPPSGATRLFLGIMDERGWWWDNTGKINTNLMDRRVTLVR